MNKQLKNRIDAAMKMASETLHNLDMGKKGAAITAAKMQARSEAFRQVIEWSGEFSAPDDISAAPIADH